MNVQIKTKKNQEIGVRIECFRTFEFGHEKKIARKTVRIWQKRQKIN